jgi:hypothetical protein
MECVPDARFLHYAISVHSCDGRDAMQETNSYLGRPDMPQNAASLLDFVRFDALDAYELTDDELARLLELWRWTALHRRQQPNGIDYDIQEAVRSLQRELAEQHGIDLEYNTALLLKQEIEAQMHWRALCDAPRAMWYFVQRARIIALVRAIFRQRRYARIDAGHSERSRDRGYPREQLAAFNARPPNLLRRRYWRSLTPHDFEARRRMKWWW